MNSADYDQEQVQGSPPKRARFTRAGSSSKEQQPQEASPLPQHDPVAAVPVAQPKRRGRPPGSGYKQKMLREQQELERQRQQQQESQDGAIEESTVEVQEPKRRGRKKKQQQQQHITAGADDGGEAGAKLLAAGSIKGAMTAETREPPAVTGPQKRPRGRPKGSGTRQQQQQGVGQLQGGAAAVAAAGKSSGGVVDVERAAQQPPVSREGALPIARQERAAHAALKPRAAERGLLDEVPSSASPVPTPNHASLAGGCPDGASSPAEAAAALQRSHMPAAGTVAAGSKGDSRAHPAESLPLPLSIAPGTESLASLDHLAYGAAGQAGGAGSEEGGEEDAQVLSPAAEITELDMACGEFQLLLRGLTAVKESIARATAVGLAAGAHVPIFPLCFALSFSCPLFWWFRVWVASPK